MFRADVEHRSQQKAEYNEGTNKEQCITEVTRNHSNCGPILSYFQSKATVTPDRTIA